MEHAAAVAAVSEREESLPEAWRDPVELERSINGKGRELEKARQELRAAQGSHGAETAALAEAESELKSATQQKREYGLRLEEFRKLWQQRRETAGFADDAT